MEPSRGEQGLASQRLGREGAMSVYHPAEWKAKEPRLSRASSVLVIGALSVASWVPVIFVGFKLWRLF